MKWLVAISLLACAGCSTPSGLRCPDEYRPQIVAEFKSADAKLAKIGYAPLGDDPDVEVIVEAGTEQVGGKWYRMDKVAYVGGEWQYGLVGGYWTPGRIVVYSAPTGAVEFGRFEHEGGHESCHRNGKGTDPNAHHAIMKSVGIHGAWQ